MREVKEEILLSKQEIAWHVEKLTETENNLNQQLEALRKESDEIEMDLKTELRQSLAKENSLSQMLE